jgi:hypothetical protein
MSQEKRRAWFADQYQHPHESKHTMGEVLRWFEESGLVFVRGVPSVTNREEDLESAGLFAPSGSGSTWSRLCVQTRQIVAGSREGGFFIMIGKLPKGEAKLPATSASKVEVISSGTL